MSLTRRAVSFWKTLRYWVRYGLSEAWREARRSTTMAPTEAEWRLALIKHLVKHRQYVDPETIERSAAEHRKHLELQGHVACSRCGAVGNESHRLLGCWSLPGSES